MRRLLAVILTLATCAFAQVQPLVLADAMRHPTCGCCSGDGACGMPDCLPPPVTTRTVPVAVQTVRITLAAATRVAAPVRRTGEKFFMTFLEPPTTPVTVRGSDRITPPASVPLFKAHCSFLI
jgi:hypothetical protein